MFVEGTRIKEKISISDFKSMIKKYAPERIECTPHTFFRLNRAQRQIITCEELKDILINQSPFLVGLQQNGNYSVFYKHQGKIWRIILKIDSRKINIVTFYFIEEWQIPKL